MLRATVEQEEQAWWLLLDMRVSAKALFLGGGAYIGAAMTAFQYYTVGQAKDHHDQDRLCDAGVSGISGEISEKQRRDAFDKGALKYDEEIGTDELVMGLPLLRRYLCWSARGRVAEIAAGTGRNFKYYNFDKVSVTACDCSDNMVNVAKQKLSMMDIPKGRATCYVMDAEKLQFEDNTFDTVVDTFGLCSFEDPVRVLKEMQRVCKPGGQILLLEHGKSHYDWLNRILDSNANKHAERWGCIWNRPIEDILQESGLGVTSLSRIHFGTTYIIKGRKTLSDA